MNYHNLLDFPEDYASFDWRLHQKLTIVSGNPIFTLILNGFAGFYEQMACIYFEKSAARSASLDFYKSLLECSLHNDFINAEYVTRSMMSQSIGLWESQERGEE
jgi:GntR family negative regulator for fad regulon and positive regulator of fabA